MILQSYNLPFSICTPLYANFPLLETVLQVIMCQPLQPAPQFSSFNPLSFNLDFTIKTSKSYRTNSAVGLVLELSYRSETVIRIFVRLDHCFDGKSTSGASLSSVFLSAWQKSQENNAD